MWTSTDLELARLLDGLLEDDVVTVDDDAGLLLDGFGDVGGGNGTEGLAGLAGGQLELDDELADGARLVLRGLEFGRLADGALGLELLGLVQVAAAGLQGQALGQQEVPGVAAVHLDDVGFGAESFDLFREDDLDGCHGSGAA